MMEYHNLCEYSSNVSYSLLKKSLTMGTPKNKEQIDFILDQSELIYSSFDPSPVCDSSASSRLLKVLDTEFDALVAGDSGESIMKRHKGLWADTNKNWLMGNYAESVDSYFSSLNVKESIALELGAGVGATSDRISNKFKKYFRSDLLKFRYNDIIINFDYPIAYFNLKFDYIVATNAVHCSSDKVKALNHIKDIMAVGGKLILAEGDPSPNGKPFALNNAYGLFDGWWNVGGFLGVSEWLSCFNIVGFKLSDLIPVKSDDTIIGYVYVLEKEGF